MLIINCLFLCPAGPGGPPLFQFCSEMLPLTLDWPHYHCCLGIFFAGNINHTLAPASSCTPSAPIYTDFLCLGLLSGPLGFEDPPPDFPVAEELVAVWICLQPLHISYIVCVLLSMRPATHFQPPAHTCSTPCTTDAGMLTCYGDAAVSLPRPYVSHLSSATSPPFVRP
jgi:hypothetical protein